MATATLLSLDQQDRFRQLIRETSGVEVPPSRQAELDRAVRQMLEETRSADTDRLYRLLTDQQHGRAPLDTLIGKLTVGETHFFRNRPQFEALEKVILPDLIGRHSGTRRLRLWSAGCSTGEEPYSLAILLKRLLPDISRWHVTILATDIDRQALERAHRGLYRSWSFREVPEGVRATWFTERDGGWEVRPEIRDLVTFDYLNLAEDVYPSIHTNTHAMDLVLCRNVMMYFREETSRVVVDRLHDALVDDAWLLVGHTDPSETLFRRFEVRNLPGTVVYRKGTSHPEEAREPARSPQARPTIVLEPRRQGQRRVTAPHPRMRRPGPPAGDGEAPAVEEAIELVHAGGVDEGRRSLERIARRDTSDPEAPYLLAKIAANRLELDEAARWLDIALRRSPVHAPSHYLRGLLLQENARLEEALDAYRRCVYADPDLVLGHFAMAGVSAQLGSPARARSSLRNVRTLLAGRERDELLPEGDGLTVGRLLELTAVHLRFVDQTEVADA